LGVSYDLSVGGIDSREVLIFAKARFEDLVASSVGGVVSTPNTIVDMFTVVGGIGTSRVACFQAERVGAHEIVPFNHLFILSTECVGEENTAHGVTALKYNLS